MVAQQYGLFREANGFSERANVLIDEKQNVVFVKVYPVHTVPDIQEVIAFIKNLTNPCDVRQGSTHLLFLGKSG